MVQQIINKSLFACAILVSLTATAKEIPNADALFLQNCAQNADCEIKLFQEISKTYRPAKEEDELRNYIIQIKETSEKNFWNQKLEFFQDKIGNIMIRLPDTRFEKPAPNPSYFALQSHMDMVLAYSEAKPGEDIRPYFKDGIQLEVVDGWLQSKGNKTTLGTDNGIGVAMALRYLINPKIAHGPLELIFTVQEEIGLIGAFNSELPILSKRMICLDGMTPQPGFIIAGAQGASAYDTTFDSIKSNEETAGAKTLIQVTVSKLAGGHSGGNIHLKRLNAMKAFAGLVKYISSEVGQVGIKSVIVGDIGVLNKIPNLFQTEISIEQSKYSPEIQARIEAFLKNLVLQNADDAKNGLIEVVIKNPNIGEKYYTTDYDFTKYIIDAILISPNGVIDENPTYANSVYTSSNLSYLKIAPNANNMMAVNLGFMTRGFLDPRILEIADGIKNNFLNPNFMANFNFVKKMDIPSWLEPETSPLLNQILSETGGLFTKKYYLAGGLEPSAYKQKIQNLEVVALGPYQLFAHSVNEKLKLDSVAPTSAAIEKIVSLQ